MFSFSKWLYENKGMVDICVPSAETALADVSKKSSFLLEPCTIEVKTDGIRLTVIKVADNGDIGDYIFAHNGNIIYENEYNYLTDSVIKDRASGASQFKLAIKHFARLGKNELPVGAELQIEFMIPRDGNKKPVMVLAQCATSEYTTNFGKLVTKQKDIITENRLDYAKALRLSVPKVLFDGVLGSKASFREGMKCSELKKAFKLVRKSLSWKDSEQLYSQLRELFLSVVGDEGVLIKTQSSILRWQPECSGTKTSQLSSLNFEPQYWENVKSTATRIAELIPLGAEPEMVTELAKRLKTLKVKDSSKPADLVKNDIQAMAKTLLFKRMTGNNGCLIIDELSTLNAGLLNTAISEFDNVCVCLVDPDPEGLEMLRQAFRDRVTLIDSGDGNVSKILPKVPFNVNVVYTSPDKVEACQSQLGMYIGLTFRDVNS